MKDNITKGVAITATREASPPALCLSIISSIVYELVFVPARYAELSIMPR